MSQERAWSWCECCGREVPLAALGTLARDVSDDVAPVVPGLPRQTFYRLVRHCWRPACIAQAEEIADGTVAALRRLARRQRSETPSLSP